MAYNPLHTAKLAFLGCGSMAQSLIRGYLNHSDIDKNRLFVSGRNVKKTQRICESLQVQMVLDNEELLEKASVIFICVKPQDMEEAISNLKACWTAHHTVLSLVAGISFKSLKKWGISSKRLVRLMPNTSVSIGEGFLPFCSLNHVDSLNFFVEELLKPLGQTLVLENENGISPVTVASSSGLAFVFELMQYWLEWLEEKGFSSEMARSLTVQTFLGASQMAKNKTIKNFNDFQKEIASPKGVTEVGLNTMRELELERVLRLSFEKVSLKIQELESIKN